jgi:segregation and condensation protein A
MRILVGEGRNNFLLEYNETEEGLTDEEHMHLL